MSNQPAAHRDMSICLADPDMELLGERIRSGRVDNVELLQRSDYGSLSATAWEWLDMSPGQQNLLIRVVLRSLESSISREEANRVSELVYAERR